MTAETPEHSQGSAHTTALFLAFVAGDHKHELKIQLGW